MARWLTILVAVLAALWSGYWFAGRTAVTRGADAAIADLRAQGWTLTYDDLSVGGFPNRFDTTVTAPRLVTPDGAFGWTAPFVQVFALSYRPNQIIAVAPPQMTFDLAGRMVEATSEDLRASAMISVSSEPELQRATLVAQSLNVDDPEFGVTVAAGQIALRQTEGRADTYDLAATLTTLRMQPFLHGLLDPDRQLPDTFELIEVDATATLPPDSQLGALDLRQATLVWGDMRIDLNGAMQVGPDRRPEGRLTLDLTGWETAFDFAMRLGLVPADRAPLIRAGLAGMAAGDGKVSAELLFENGQMRLGAIPLGPAPQL
ncbi:DUF2125 domain-containing protein [Jannaschia pohangensis]|uniref:DUF2125 domain-containing protein n=1 Tax=Jannaschia pohangensis TaxID=390807 RepID=A0A1I3QMF0_9RHOB|nr:DUF2125 domain-containing protein [Jannaschia pohangensis]SFJ35000.1 hypothetical protein SAMN04488095_2595 [Jannaschia pohangensis]